MKTLIIFALLATACLAATAGDFGGPISTSTLACAKKNGWSLMITRGYHSTGYPDTSAPSNLANGVLAGFKYRDVYHFPCFAVDPAQQVTDDIKNAGLGSFDMIWLDIETNFNSRCGWSKNTGNNCQFVQNMISAAQAAGARVGIYTSISMWQSVVGVCTVGADAGLPLWYAHYDGKQTFSDFRPFGGWTTPAMKQYADSVGICGINADADWY